MNNTQKRTLRRIIVEAALLLLLLPLASFGILRRLTPLPPQTVAGMALAWWILPIGFALIHPSRQFLYDYLAGTVLTGKGREETHH